MNARLWVCATMLSAVPAFAADIATPLIDYDTFASNVVQVGEFRDSRRVTEAQFIRMAAQPGTVVLDARSAGMFARLHVKGAVNLSLPDITEEELAKIIPSKHTRILIYCNNNFLNAPGAFPTKIAPASLNVHTFNVLFAYGYKNVYELGPLIDVETALLKFEGTQRSS
jgi:phage shock protein E